MLHCKQESTMTGGALSYALLSSLYLAARLNYTSSAPVSSGNPTKSTGNQHHHLHGDHQQPTGPTTKDEVDWWNRGQAELEQALNMRRESGVAKNVILFVGDGMGMSTVTAARFYLAQAHQLNVHDTLLAWEQFPHVALTRTYNTNQQTADSAGTATAFLSGYKTRAGTLGVDSHVTRGNCSTVQGHKVKSVLHHSHEAGRWTGIVTTTRVTHATPAAAYATSADRSWESDSDVPKPDRKACKDIARQLVEDNHFIRVVLGGGRWVFLPHDERDPERHFRGARRDGRNLIKEWYRKQVKKTSEEEVGLVMNLAQLNDLNLTSVQYLMGLFEGSHMQYEADRQDPEYETWGEPSLAEMTQAAITVLKKGPKGFFLLVEGGRIDHAHHDGNAHRALTDTVAMSDAVAKALEMTDSSDTLIVVTADHSHTFTMSGYSTLHNDILGLANEIYDGNKVRLSLADDGLPYTTLNYANGPGWYRHRAEGSHTVGFSPIPGRRNLTSHGLKGLTAHKDFRQDALFPVRDETHGGEDVTVHALGPLSHLFHGTHDQSFIAHVLMYASCVGPNQRHCTKSCSNCCATTANEGQCQSSHLHCTHCWDAGGAKGLSSGCGALHKRKISAQAFFILVLYYTFGCYITMCRCIL